MQLSEERKQYIYTDLFFQELREISRQSAQEIVPLILEMIDIDSVVDVGCGDGTWLKVFQEYGVKKIKGIDGNYVNKHILVIPDDDFMDFDLKHPLHLTQQFDLAISLEVAEHLPPECAEDFIDSLTALSPVVLFSAAIPYQEGDDHVNLQWQEFWAELFAKRGYLALDYIRQQVWSNSKVASYYRHNAILFIQQDYFDLHSLKNKLGQYRVKDLSLLSVIHPLQYQYAIDSARKMAIENSSVKPLLNYLFKALTRSISRRLGIKS